MAADLTAVESNAISALRQDLTILLNTLAQLDKDRLKITALGGEANFVANAFAGVNVDLVASDLTTAIATLVTFRGLLYDATNTPKAALLGLVKASG